MNQKSGPQELSRQNSRWRRTSGWVCRSGAVCRRYTESVERGFQKFRSAAIRPPARLLEVVRRHLPSETQYLFFLTLLVGALCGLAAVAFHFAIRFAEHFMIDAATSAPNGRWMVYTIVSPTVGGLLAGIVLSCVVPGARGSGIPQVKQAYATEGGRIRLRDALGKFFVGSFQIGSGASLGREGPTVQICAGVASLVARVTALSPSNIRRLTPVGVAAGIAAAFNAPVAAVTFTIEELVGTLDHGVLSGVVIAAAIAAVIERSILGSNPVIAVAQDYALDHPTSLMLYAVLGVAAALVSVAFTDGLLSTRRAFRRLGWLPVWAHPALGGLVTGMLAVLVLRSLGTTGVTGGGYVELGHALEGELSLMVVAALCVAKLLATVASYSSGGAGGIFAPSLFIGAMLGGVVGHLDVLLLGHGSTQLGAFALVGMGAMFAGVIRAPITSVLIIFEMTGAYGLVLPLMIANMTSYVVARRLRSVPIYRALLEQDGVVLPQYQAPVAPPQNLRVSDAMSDQLREAESDTPLDERQAVRTDDPLSFALLRMNELETRVLSVVDAATGVLVGTLAMGDVVRAFASRGPARTVSVAPPETALVAAVVMIPAVQVASAAQLPTLAKALRAGEVLAYVVGEPARAVLMVEHLEEVPPDEEFERMLIAADVARAAPAISYRANLPQMVASFRDSESNALIVFDAFEKPIGVVTRGALGLSMLNAYASAAGPVAMS